MCKVFFTVFHLYESGEVLKYWIFAWYFKSGSLAKIDSIVKLNNTICMKHIDITLYNVSEGNIIELKKKKKSVKQIRWVFGDNLGIIFHIFYVVGTH